MTFADYIAERLTTPFVWGENDCALFAAGWVKVSTGRDPLAALPAWRGKRSALALQKQVGGMERVLDQQFARINPHLATDGCIALRNGSLHLFCGANIVGPGEGGLVFISRMEAACAWQV